MIRLVQSSDPEEYAKYGTSITTLKELVGSEGPALRVAQSFLAECIDYLTSPHPNPEQAAKMARCADWMIQYHAHNQ